VSVLGRGLEAHLSKARLQRLARAKIGIAGAGGLGSNVAALLTRSGVRRFVVADSDVVAASNLNRQFFWPEDVGRPKVEALKARLLALEPELDFEDRRERLDPDSAPGVFRGCEMVVEALDEAKAKASLTLALLQAGFFVVAASGIGGCGLEPLALRRLGAKLVCVGDFATGVDEHTPPLAPRVTQAAAMQADAVLARLLGKG
jgi:sulfur carrier protein ThiS adenylyltransferase